MMGSRSCHLDCSGRESFNDASQRLFGLRPHGEPSPWVCATRYKTFDLNTDIPLDQREVYGPTA